MPHIIDYLLFDEYTSDPTISGVPEGGFWYNTTEDRLKQKVGTVSGTQVRVYTVTEDIPAHPTVVANTQHATTASGNPHNTSKVDIGLGNVVDGQQLLRSADDFDSFDEKTTLGSSDIVLIEDSSDGGTKKKVEASQFISGGFDIDNIIWDNSGGIVYDDEDIAVRRT